MEFVVREIIMITVKGFKFEKEWINYYNDIVKYKFFFYNIRFFMYKMFIGIQIIVQFIIYLLKFYFVLKI